MNLFSKLILTLYSTFAPFGLIHANYSLEKPIVVLITSYNNSKWLEKNLTSVVRQKYSNYRVIYVDDCSTDDTAKMAKEFVAVSEQMDKFTIVCNRERVGALANIYEAVHSCKDEEIIVSLDGDDWLSDRYVLKKINRAYSYSDVWLTHGTLVEFPTNIRTWSIPIPDQIVKSNSFRAYRCPSHLRTFYAWLFKKIDIEDLMYDGHFFPMTWDQAMMFPMIEMAGERHAFIPETVYIYNLVNSINDNKVNADLQNSLEKLIRSKPPYQRLDRGPIEPDPLSRNPELNCTEHFVEGKLTGQLGNQMFIIAATTSLALDHGAIPVFPSLAADKWNHLPLNFEPVFHRLDTSIPNSHKITVYQEPSFTYQEIPFTKDMQLQGYFQSEKYFRNHKKIITDLFAPTPEISQYLNTKYAHILSHPNTVAVHIRSYRRFDPEQKTYIQCGKDYCKKAMELFPTESLFVVFSDDMRFCKRELRKLSRNMVFIEGEPFYHDLYLMSMCKHNIISNSSFSWWGAYLNQNPDKKVVAPTKWFADGSGLSEKDLIPEGWITITL
jgi:glycosyltransferase involved in cell wall biosynthesis